MPQKKSKLSRSFTRFTLESLDFFQTFQEPDPKDRSRVEVGGKEGDLLSELSAYLVKPYFWEISLNLQLILLQARVGDMLKTC